MNMMQLFPNRRMPASFQHVEQVADAELHRMLEQADKSALIARLNDEHFSPETLRSLLYKAFSAESPDVLAMMLKTRSYASEVVLANIIVESLNKEPEENEQERFVAEIMLDESLKVKVLARALDIVSEKGSNLNDGGRLVEKLIKSAALSFDEKVDITEACPYMDEFVWTKNSECEDSDFLSTSVIDEIAVTDEAPQAAFIVEGPFSTIVDEVKMEIGHFLTIKDLLQYGQVSQGFNRGMQLAVTNRTSIIHLPQLTDAAMATLGKVSRLKLGISHANLVSDAKMERMGQLANLHALDFRFSGVKDLSPARLERFPKLHSINFLIKGGCFTGDMLSYLEKLSALDTLYLDCLDSPAQQQLGKLTSLHTLYLVGIWDDSWQGLEKLINLQTLTLIGCDTPHDGFLNWEKLVKLHTLNLIDAIVTDNGLQQLVKATNLTNLTLLAARGMTKAGLQHLEKLTHLHELACDFTTTEFADEGLHRLGKLTNLRTLDLSGKEITNSVLHHLHQLTNLRTLYLSNTKVTDHGWRCLKKILPNLRIYVGDRPWQV